MKRSRRLSSHLFVLSEALASCASGGGTPITIVLSNGSAAAIEDGQTHDITANVKNDSSKFWLADEHDHHVGHL